MSELVISEPGSATGMTHGAVKDRVVGFLSGINMLSTSRLVEVAGSCFRTTKSADKSKMSIKAGSIKRLVEYLASLEVIHPNEPALLAARGFESARMALMSLNKHREFGYMVGFMEDEIQITLPRADASALGAAGLLDSLDADDLEVDGMDLAMIHGIATADEAVALIEALDNISDE